MKKKWIIILVLAAAGAWWVWRRARTGPPASPEVKTARVARGDIELRVEATGSVESNLDVEIKSKASGEVILVPHDVSDRVPRHQPGQNESESLLAALDPADESRGLERAQAARDAALATLRQAQAARDIAEQNLHVAGLEANAAVESAAARLRLDELTLQRQRELLARGAATQSELDAAEATERVSRAELRLAEARQEALKALALLVGQRQAEVELATAQLAAAEAVHLDARQRLTDTKVYSPIDGVITRRDVQVGQIVASGILTVGGGTALMTVSDLSRVFVMAEVHESDIGRLVETRRLNQEADITADAYPGKRFRGQVVRITPRGFSEAKVISFYVKVEVLGEGKELLLPKMTADVRILADARSGVLLVPNQCLHYEKDRPYVEVKRGGGFERRWVVLGLNDGVQAEVIEGLQEGEEVALGSGTTSRWMKAATGPVRSAEATSR